MDPTKPFALPQETGAPLNPLELTSVHALLAYTAHNNQVSEDMVREALTSHFGVNDVHNLPRHTYDDVIRFLVDIQAELIVH